MRVAHLFAIAAVALAACATQSTSPNRAAQGNNVGLLSARESMSPQKTTQYKNVGVLSAMGDRFSETAFGTVASGDKFALEPVAFGADDVLTAKIKDALSPRYNVSDLGQYRTAFLAPPEYWEETRSMMPFDAPRLADLVRQLMGGEHLDAYILVTPAGCRLRASRGVGGVGVVKLPHLLDDNDYRLHAAYFVSVVDGHDFSMVADMRAFPIGESGSVIFAFYRSQLGCPNAPAPAQYLAAPSENVDGIRASFADLMDRSIPHTLRATNLME